MGNSVVFLNVKFSGENFPKLITGLTSRYFGQGKLTTLACGLNYN
jgi:hypothetical protein